jgi:hypothetical protein
MEWVVKLKKLNDKYISNNCFGQKYPQSLTARFIPQKCDRVEIQNVDKSYARVSVAIVAVSTTTTTMITTTTQIKAESAIAIPNSGTPKLPPEYLDSILPSLSIKLTKKEPVFQDHSLMGYDAMQFGR